jgi:GNAT superfamily N-acetyltransferase
MIVVRPASKEDVPLVFELICELADYERLRHAVRATIDDVREALFGSRPCCEAVVAAVDGADVAFALFFHNFSTFAGRPGLYLEDVYVRPAARGRGVGRALLAHLAGLAVERNCARMEWAALDWNEPAIRFYEGLGAEKLDDWRLFRLSGEALQRAADAPS